MKMYRNNLIISFFKKIELLLLIVTWLLLAQT